MAGRGTEGSGRDTARVETINVVQPAAWGYRMAGRARLAPHGFIRACCKGVVLCCRCATLPNLSLLLPLTQLPPRSHMSLY